MTKTPIKTRLYLEDDLSPSAEIGLNDDQVHFLANVLRLKVEDRIGLFNSRDGEWQAKIVTLKKRKAIVQLERQLREPAPEPGPWVAFAPLKKTRNQMVIEKATELGVEKIVPVITENTVGGRVNRERMQAQAIEASEQCERLTLPEVCAPRTLDEFVQSWPPERLLLVGDETGGGLPIAELISSNSKKSSDYGILIGPEGGFKPAERDALKGVEFCRFMDLGPRILRAETAVIAALACIQALT